VNLLDCQLIGVLTDFLLDMLHMYLPVMKEFNVPEELPGLDWSTHQGFFIYSSLQHSTKVG